MSEKRYSMSEKQRMRLEKRLEEVDKALSAIGMEWFPNDPAAEASKLKAEKRSLEDTLQYDDMVRAERIDEAMYNKEERELLLGEPEEEGEELV